MGNAPTLAYAKLNAAGLHDYVAASLAQQEAFWAYMMATPKLENPRDVLDPAVELSVFNMTLMVSEVEATLGFCGAMYVGGFWPLEEALVPFADYDPSFTPLDSVITMVHTIALHNPPGSMLAVWVVEQRRLLAILGVRA